MVDQARVELSQRQHYKEWDKVKTVAAGAMPEHQVLVLHSYVLNLCLVLLKII